ncbi:MAG: glycosyltransferase family 2 protein [Pseudomonadota bacterium]
MENALRSSRKPRVAAFTPVFNEENHVGKVLDGLAAVVRDKIVDQVVVVDDGSTDRTPEILRRYDFVRVVRHERRRGCGAAIRSALEALLPDGFDVAVPLAANGKDDPAQIQRLLEPILAEEADYVQGSRFLRGGERTGLPWQRLLAMWFFVWMFRLFLWKWYTDCTNGFRAYRTTLLRDPRVDWRQAWLGNDYELEMYLHYQASALGYRVKEVPVSKVYRRAPGQSYSKARLANWWTGLRTVIYLRFGFRR